MSWSFLIILCIVASLILGPIMMLRPSPEQKRKEKLRLLARTLGLHFTQRKLPIVAGDSESNFFPIAVYFVPPAANNMHMDWLLMRASYAHEMHLLGNWTWMGQERASEEELKYLIEFLGDVSDSVKAISGGRSGYSVYWSEKGSEDLVRSIADFLHSIQKKSELLLSAKQPT